MSLVILYRAVSIFEYNQLMTTRRFEIVAESVEGKYFAETASGAAEWGRRLFEITPHRILQLTFDQRLADQFYRWQRLDGIGPARYATIEQLLTIEVRIQEIDR